MAQTHNAPHIEPENGVDPEVVKATADQAAWLAAAKENAFETHADNVWGYSGDCLVSIPAPHGFGALTKGMQEFIFRPVVQMVLTRVVQTTVGDAQEAVRYAMKGLILPKPEHNDAREAIYRRYIRNLIEKQLGEDTLKGMSTAEFDATCDKYREAAFMKAIDAALAAATDRKAGKEASTKPRKKAAAKDLAI